MKITHILSVFTASIFALSHAQADQSWNGGSANWDVGTTAAWDGGSTWVQSYDTGTATFTNPDNTAVFQSAGGTVTIDDSQPGGNVGANALYFNNGNNGAYTLTGDTIYTGAAFNSALINLNTNSGPVTIDNTIFHVGGDNQDIVNNSNSAFTFNGTLDYDHQTTLFMANNGSGTFVFNGTVANAGESGLYLIGGQNIEFGASSDLTSLDSTHNGSNLSLVVAGANAILDADTFLSTSNMEFLGGNGDATHGILTNGAFVGTQFITDERTSGLIGGAAPVSSGWSGGFYMDNNPSTFTFSQVAGGRFTYSGSVIGNNATYMITSGAGTVILASNSTYGGNNTLAADLTAKRTLLTNSSGTTPFGSNTGAVQVESGATLGGTGFAGENHLVVAAGPGSIIAPGDSGADGGTASIGTLTLDGGLDTSNGGVTLAFKVNGLSNDTLSFGGADFDPTGVMTVDISSMNGLNNILSNHYYTFIDPTQGLIDGDDLTSLNIIAPYGYAVEDSKFDTFDGLQVEFIAAPEPSTYALMLGGLGFLAFCLRRKNRASV